MVGSMNALVRRTILFPTAILVLEESIILVILSLVKIFVSVELGTIFEVVLGKT